MCWVLCAWCWVLGAEHCARPRDKEERWSLRLPCITSGSKRTSSACRLPSSWSSQDRFQAQNLVAASGATRHRDSELRFHPCRVRVVALSSSGSEERVALRAEHRSAVPSRDGQPGLVSPEWAHVWGPGSQGPHGPVWIGGGLT